MRSSCLFTGANVRPNNGVISLPSCKWTEPSTCGVQWIWFKEDYYDSTPSNVLAKAEAVCIVSGLCVCLCAQWSGVCVVIMTNITVWCHCLLS